MYKVRDFAEERSRTLYVRLPHTIRNAKEVEELFEGVAKVKLPRQSSRACHVIFPSLEEKVKGLKNVKDKKVDGKRVIALNPKTKPTEKKISRKKVVVPKPKSEPKITKSLYVSNIKNKTTIEELKAAFPGCIYVNMLDLNAEGLRWVLAAKKSAFLKMESFEVAGEYIRKERQWPEVRGNSLSLNVDTRRSTPRRGAKSKKHKKDNKEEKPDENELENMEQNKNTSENIEESDKSEVSDSEAE